MNLARQYLRCTDQAPSNVLTTFGEMKPMEHSQWRTDTMRECIIKGIHPGHQQDQYHYVFHSYADKWRVEPAELAGYTDVQSKMVLGSAYAADILTTGADEMIFRALVASWHEERGATSSITSMAMCPSYQRIIAMGPDVVPMILRQMESEGDQPDMWFWALRVLTGADPISEDARGDIVRMARAWLDWARTWYVW